MQFRAWLSALALAATLLFLAGCGSDPYKAYPVKGIIVYEEDGQPVTGLAGGSVTFMPIAEESGRASSSATILDDGSFVLSYKKEGDGAIAGKHRVVIEPQGQEEDPDADAPKKRRQPIRRVMDPDSAIQEATVEPKSNNLTLKVRRPAMRGPAKR